MLRNIRRKHPKLCRGLIDAARRKEAVARARRVQGRSTPSFERLRGSHARRPARSRGTITNRSTVDARMACTKPEATQAMGRLHLVTVLDPHARMLIETSVWIEEEIASSPDTPKGGAQGSNSETSADLMPTKQGR